MKTERIGTKTRAERQKSGFTLRELAKRLGISLITLQRIETGKSSPSVALLSEIAHQLNRSILSFLEEQKDNSFIHIKRKSQQTISRPALREVHTKI
jgi:transcriptional regulator with XRE-family HTH domain